MHRNIPSKAPAWGYSLDACMHAKSFQSCLTLCDPVDHSLTGSSVHGVLQARILEWVAMPSSGDHSDPEIKPASLMSPALAGGFFATWEAQATVHRVAKSQTQLKQCNTHTRTGVFYLVCIVLDVL